MRSFPTFHRILAVAQRFGIGSWLLRAFGKWQRSAVVRFCALIWLIILCVAPLQRLATLSYTSGNFFSLWSSYDDEYGEQSGETPAWYHDANEDAETIAPQNDRMALIVKAEKRVDDVATSGGYDELLRRFPTDIVVLSGYLRRHITIYGTGGRRPLYSGRVSKFTPKIVPLPKDLNASIAVAQRAQKLEPRNAFFDLALTTMLVAAKRDAEAYRVLEAGSRKPNYDDHTLEAAHLEFQQRERERALNLEEKALLAQQSGYKRHNANLSSCLELLSWQTWRDEGGPNAATFAVRSLQRRASIARIAAKMLVGRQVSTYETFSFGNQPILNAWRKSLQSRPRYLSSRNFAASNNALAQAFAARARALNQPQIAEETERIRQLSEGFRQTQRRASYENFSLGSLQALAGVRWLARTQIVLCIALYLLLSLAVIKTGADGFSLPASRKIVIDGATSSFIVFLFMLSHVFRSRANIGTNVLDTIMWRPWFLMAPFLSLLHGHWKLSRQRAQLSRHNALQERLIEYSKRAPLRKIYDFCSVALIVQVALVLLIVMWHILRRQWSVRIPLPNRPPLFWSLQPSIVQLLALVLIALLLLQVVVSWRWLASSVERNFTFPALRSLRRCSGQFIAVAHALFLIAIVASLPTQAAANDRIENYWRDGNAWLATGFTSADLLARIDTSYSPPTTSQDNVK